jgi:hypothetical protein
MQTKTIALAHASLETGGNKFGHLDSPYACTCTRFIAEVLRMKVFLFATTQEKLECRSSLKERWSVVQSLAYVKARLYLSDLSDLGWAKLVES